MPAFEWEPITTVYLQYAAGLRLERPFFALVDQPDAGCWGQFVFDRGQLNDADAGLLAVVISASGPALDLGNDSLASAGRRAAGAGIADAGAGDAGMDQGDIGEAGDLRLHAGAAATVE